MAKKYRPMFAKKKSHKVRNTFIVLLLLVFVLVGFVAYAEVFAGMRKDNTAVSVYFPVDASEADIITILTDNGIIKSPAVFKLCSVFSGNDYVNGSHILTKSMTYPQILAAIKSKNNGSVIAVVVNEGDTIDDIALIVSDELEISKDDFYTALQNGDYPVETSRTAKKYEGYLLPGTYNFTKDSDAAAVVSAMLKRFDEFFTDEKLSRVKQLGLTVDQTVTMASLVQLEADSKDAMSGAADVIYQKYKDGVLLESEAALKYSLNKNELSQNDKMLVTPYNTFMYKGLPKGPICSPGEDALNAVLN